MTTTKIPIPSPLPVKTKLPAHQADPRIANQPAQKKPTILRPKLRLKIQDLRHKAVPSFLSLIPDLEAVLDAALEAIVEQLYTSPRSSQERGGPGRNEGGKTPPEKKPHEDSAPFLSFKPQIPPTRSVTIILQDFEGVAYTNGTDLDDDHKEIHFSLSYINHVCTNKAKPLDELRGVLTHELVHCYQHTAPPPPPPAEANCEEEEINNHENGNDAVDEKGNNHELVAQQHPPGGLIEGIADFVRLKAGLGADHWTKPKSAADRASSWDAGYQHTAFFLAWLEDVHFGRGAIGLVNDRLLRVGYLERRNGAEDGESQRTPGPPGFWKGLFGAEVEELWEEYGRYLDKQ